MFHAFILACSLANGTPDCDIYQKTGAEPYAERRECTDELRNGMRAMYSIPDFQKQLEGNSLVVRAICHEAEGNWNPKEHVPLIIALYGPNFNGQDS